MIDINVKYIDYTEAKYKFKFYNELNLNQIFKQFLLIKNQIKFS
jgi:hypothetical protein